MRDRQLGRSRAVHPLGEECLEVASADGFEGLADVVEAGTAILVVPVELLEGAPEIVVADLNAKHVPHHCCLAVADGRRRCVGAGQELAQRELVVVGHVVGIALQRRAPVVIARTALLGDQVVGHVRRQPFTPVAGVEVDKDTVAPPVVEQLVRVGRVQDEREADYLWSEQCERWHAVARFPEVLHEGELGVGVGPNEVLVHLHVLGGCLEVLVGEAIILVTQKGHSDNVADRVLVLDELRSNHEDFFRRRINEPRIDVPVPLVDAVATLALADRLPASRHAYGHLVGNVFLAECRYPVGRAGKVYALFVDKPG